MSKDERDAVVARLRDTDKRFAEFANQHEACGSQEAELLGTDDVTTLRCSKCGATCTANDLDLELYLDYLKEFKGATNSDIEQIVVPPVSDRPS